MIDSHKKIICEARTIQPYFTLCTSSNYNLKVMEDSPISYFYSFVADRSDGKVLAVPDASIDILFLCDGHDSEARLCGSTTTAKLVDIQKGKYYFGVRFKPGYIPDFINMHSKNLVDQEFPIDKVIPQATSLLKNITSTKNFEEQIQLFLDHFQGEIHYKHSPFATQIREKITKNNGVLKISNLEEYSGYSSRYISKVFMEYFGLSPKSYALILRFQYILQHIILDSDLSLTDAASDLGYSDQSHFSREFKRFTAQAPGQFIQAVKKREYSSSLSIDDEILALRHLH